MFPPASPTTERVRIQNELRELERRAARNAAMRVARPNFPFRWSLRGRIEQFTSGLVASLTQPAAQSIRSTQTQPPACDC